MLWEGEGGNRRGLANFYYYLFVLLVRWPQSKQYEIMLIFCSFHLKCLNVNQAASEGCRGEWGVGSGEGG